MALDQDDIELALAECDESAALDGCPFNDWEREFLESVMERWEEKNNLTPKQEKILEKLWDKI